MFIKANSWCGVVFVRCAWIWHTCIFIRQWLWLPICKHMLLISVCLRMPRVVGRWPTLSVRETWSSFCPIFTSRNTIGISYSGQCTSISCRLIWSWSRKSVAGLKVSCSCWVLSKTMGCAHDIGRQTEYDGLFQVIFHSLPLHSGAWFSQQEHEQCAGASVFP